MLFRLAVILAVVGVVHGATQQEQQCSMPAEAVASAWGPKFFLCDDSDGSNHLDNVKDVLLMLGYTETSNAADSNLMWCWSNPFVNQPDLPRLSAAHLQLKRLESRQFVNQIPGLGSLATKEGLTKYSRSLQFLPKTFFLPKEYEAWQKFIKEDEQGASLEWIKKNMNHRGIAVISDTAATELRDSQQEFLVQQLIRPYLIDGRLWDFGVYVGITSIEPLTAYIFTGSVLLRFCSKPYVRNISNETDPSSYVISGLDDFLPGMDVPSMQPHYKDAAADTVMGSTMSLAAIQSYLSSHGVATKEWWLDVQSVVVQMLQHTVPSMVDQRRYYYPGSRTNFFTLVRFDFMLDENSKNYLIEVNMSPGLYWPGVDRKEQLLSRKLVHDLLTLKGLGPGGHNNLFTNPDLAQIKYHPDAIALGEPACAGGCDDAKDCSSKPQCMLCRVCRSQWQNGLLVSVLAEQRNAEGFMRVHPPGRQLSSHMAAARVDFESYFDVDSRPDDVLVKLWLEQKCEHDYRFC